jgi:hypothetical protein
MGQMGNSDEATIPDDLPFGMADLVVIAGGKDEPKEMAEGGILTGQQGLFADPRFASQRSAVQTYTPAQIENIRSGLGGQFAQIQEDIKPTEEAKTDAPVVTTPEVVAEKTPERETGFDRRQRETRGFNSFIAEQKGHGGAFSTIKQFADRDAVDWLKAATDINSLAGDIVTKLPIVGDLVSMSYQGARDYIKTLDKSKLDSDTRFAIEIFEKSKKPKGILSVIKDVFQGKTLKEAFTPEEYEQLTEKELAKIKEIRDRAKLEAKKRRDEYNNMSPINRTQRTQFLNVGVYNDGSGTIIQMKGDKVLYQVNGRNTYVSVSDIIKQGDDPSLLMERILASRYVGYDENGKPISVKSEAEVNADIPDYAQDNADTGTEISNNLKVLKEEDMPPERPDSIESVVASTEGEGPPLDAFEIIPSVDEGTDKEDPLDPFGGKGPEIKSVENILNKAASLQAPEIEDVDIPDATGAGEGPPLDVPELIDPDITDLEKTVELDDYSNMTQEEAEKIGDAPQDLEKIKNYVGLADVAKAGEVASIQAGDDEKSTEYPSKGLELLGESGIVDKAKDFGLNLFDSLKSSWAEGRKKQEERNRILADNIRKNKIARQDAARAAEVEQAKKQADATRVDRQMQASADIDAEINKRSKDRSDAINERIKKIRDKQKVDAMMYASGAVDTPPPTAPTIKYDAPAGPFAKGGLAKMKAKKPAKKRKGGLASKKK